MAADDPVEAAAAEAAAASRPFVPLEWDVMWCARHLEPYRAKWPQGAAPAMLKLFQAAAGMPAVAEAAHGQAGQLPAALARFKPVCCFVGGQVLDAIYAETLPPAP